MSGSCFEQSPSQSTSSVSTTASTMSSSASNFETSRTAAEDRVMTSGSISDQTSELSGKDILTEVRCQICLKKVAWRSKSSLSLKTQMERETHLLSLHMKGHMKGNSYLCDFCQEDFANQSNLVEHLNDKHAECLQPLPSCRICNQTFTSYDQIKAHYKMCKFSIYTFSTDSVQCEICQTKLTYKCRLSVHLRSHK